MKAQTQSSKGISRDIILRQIGRPVALTKKHIDTIIDYFESYEPYYELPKETQKKSGEIVTEMVRVPNALPTLADLAQTLGVKRNTIYNWNDRNTEFRELYRKLKNKYEEELIVNQAILGKFNSNFSKFYLINKHGYQDKIDVNTSGSSKTPKQFNTQINYFLGQQGVEPLKHVEELAKDGILPAFKSDIDEVDEAD